jgi:hypothetical protein
MHGCRAAWRRNAREAWYRRGLRSLSCHGTQSLRRGEAALLGVIQCVLKSARALLLMHQPMGHTSRRLYHIDTSRIDSIDFDLPRKNYRYL